MARANHTLEHWKKSLVRLLQGTITAFWGITVCAHIVSSPFLWTMLRCHQGHLLDAPASFTQIATSGRINHPALGFQSAAQVAVFSWPQPKDHWCAAQRNTTYQGFITPLQLSLISDDELILDLSFTAFRQWCCLGPFASLFYLTSH